MYIVLRTADTLQATCLHVQLWIPCSVNQPIELADPVASSASSHPRRSLAAFTFDHQPQLHHHDYMTF